MDYYYELDINQPQCIQDRDCSGVKVKTLLSRGEYVPLRSCCAAFPYLNNGNVVITPKFCYDVDVLELADSPYLQAYCEGFGVSSLTMGLNAIVILGAAIGLSFF